MLYVVCWIGVVSRVAGTAGSSGIIDGSGTNARFGYPTGIAVSTTEAGTIYVVDNTAAGIIKVVADG